MKQLIIIRHGEADHMEKGLTGGWTDSLFTEKGRHKAALTGKYLCEILKRKKISSKYLVFYCSDLKRTKETAEIIGNKINVQPVPEEALREFNNGKAAYLSNAEAFKIMNPAKEPYIDWRPFEGGDSWRTLNQRITGFMNSINDDEGSVIIVSHEAAIVHLIHWWLDSSEECIQRITYPVEPCSVTILGKTKLPGTDFEQRTIEKLNDTGHLSKHF